MPYPVGLQYEVAVQNPLRAFDDWELQQCSVVLQNGMPRVWSGGFAATFCMERAASAWAVRCFTRPVPQLERRYTIIGKFFAQHSPEFLTRAELLVRGVRVGADWHPVIKMPWVQGRTLNSFIGSRLGTLGQLIPVRDDLLKLAGAMRSLNMAHGDLQHGNVIVLNGRLKLVDYDGIYVPDLKGLPSSEIGFKHYQHPDRGRSHWGPAMDNFSLIVLYIGLSAVANGPTLWSKFDNGVNVLFNASDFADPLKSPLFKELRKLPGLGSMPEQFQEICKAGLDKVPTLNDFVSQTKNGRGSMHAVGAGTATGGKGKRSTAEVLAPYLLWTLVGVIIVVVFGRNLFGSPGLGRPSPPVVVASTVVRAPVVIPDPTRIPVATLAPTVVPPPTATATAVATAVNTAVQFPTALPTTVPQDPAGPAVITCSIAGEWTDCGGKPELGLCDANKVGYCTDQLIYECRVDTAKCSNRPVLPGPTAAPLPGPSQSGSPTVITCSNKGEWTECGGKADLGICAPKEVGHCTDQGVYECVVENNKCNVSSNVAGGSAVSFPPPTILFCKPKGGMINISGVKAWWVEHRYSFGVLKEPGNGNTGKYMTIYERAIFTALDGSEGIEWCRGELWK